MNEAQRIDAFQQSWSDAETFFAMNIIILGSGWLKPIYEFIFYTRYTGSLSYTQQLRAGQSLKGFMLSRAVEYGLEPGQPYLEFSVEEDGTIHITYNDGQATHQETIDTLVERGDSPDDFRGFHPRVAHFLGQLTAQPLS